MAAVKDGEDPRGGGAYRPSWRLTKVEMVGVLLGAVMGLAATAPLLWLAAEARRISHPEITPAARFLPGELLLLWLGGSVIGGYLAAHLSRPLRDLPEAALRRGRLSLLWRLLGGCLLLVLVAPAPMAIVLGLIKGGPRAIPGVYLVGGALVGWEPAVIAFVFLYTFRLLERLRGDE